MFANAIKELPLTDALASELFTNINADYFDGDATFCATLRYLLYKRLRSNESINVRLINKFAAENFDSILPLENDTIYIVVMKGSSLEGFEQAKIHAKGVHDILSYQEHASRYLSQANCMSSVYVNEDKRITFVLTQNMTMKFWRKIQSSLTRLLPWHFPAPIEADERAFLHTLNQKDSSEYLDYIAAYAKKFNFHEDRLNKLLKDFGLSYEKMRLTRLQKDKAENAEAFSKAQDEIKKCIAKERDIQIAILGIEELLDKGDGTGLADYFIRCKCLHLVNVENDEMSYVVTAYLDYFDQSVFEKFMSNSASYFYKKKNGVAENQTEYKKLLHALFGDEPTLKIRTSAEFKMSLSGTLNAVHKSKVLEKYPDWIPHPHIDGAQCLGSNAQYINEMMMRKNYIEAIEQTIAAVRNINFTDSVIAANLIAQIQTSEQRFIELPTGEVVSPPEAVTWLLKQEEAC